MGFAVVTRGRQVGDRWSTVFRPAGGFSIKNITRRPVDAIMWKINESGAVAYYWIRKKFSSFHQSEPPKSSPVTVFGNRKLINSVINHSGAAPDAVTDFNHFEWNQ